MSLDEVNCWDLIQYQKRWLEWRKQLEDLAELILVWAVKKMNAFCKTGRKLWEAATLKWPGNRCGHRAFILMTSDRWVAFSLFIADPATCISVTSRCGCYDWLSWCQLWEQAEMEATQNALSALWVGLQTKVLQPIDPALIFRVKLGYCHWLGVLWVD